MPDMDQDPNLGLILTIPEFLETAGTLTTEERLIIVDQAIILIEELYAHLPLKKAMHATEPVQRLKILRRKLSGISERKFHNEMISIFVEVRDLHTNYLLPLPYAVFTAFLPFLLEDYYQDGQRRYIVTRVFRGFNHDTFQPGVDITHWNGVPIDLAVSNIADREAGSNEHARHVRGLDRMTIRPMIMSLPPDEEWVIIGYTDGTNDYEIKLDWKVFRPDSSPGAQPEGLKANEAQFLSSQGLDLLTEETNKARKILFAPKALEAEQRVAKLDIDDTKIADLDQATLGEDSILPNVFRFKTVSTDHGEYGYIRIFTFSANPSIFISEFIRILSLMPANGVIIDVRGNGGGIIMNGERILQLITSREITAERLQLINTEQTLILADTPWGGRFLERWKKSIELSLFTGAVYSQGFPIEAQEITNSIGQKYFGPTVVITDAKCYSTTDIFAAGYQDHQIGTILGVDGNTGAGGANVFTHGFLVDLFAHQPDSPLRSLPKGANMRVAIRRTIRVGENVGLPLEDLGVVPDQIHRLTRNDVLNDNEDLINVAAAILAQVESSAHTA